MPSIARLLQPTPALPRLAAYAGFATDITSFRQISPPSPVAAETEHSCGSYPKRLSEGTGIDDAFLAGDRALRRSMTKMAATLVELAGTTEMRIPSTSA